MPGPLVIAAGIQAGASLIGGLLGNRNNKKAIAAQNAYNHPRAIRARAESAGFNPLLFVGPGVGQQTSVATDMMGSAIANAGLAVGDGLSKLAELDAYNSALEEQNAELRKAVERATLRPEVAGIYGRAQPVTLPEAPVVDRYAINIAKNGGLGYGNVGRGETLDAEHGFPTVVTGPLPDRPTEINPLQNEPWFKMMNIAGEDVKVWNDDASDNEFMSTAMMATVPYQVLKKKFDRWDAKGQGWAKRGVAVDFVKDYLPPLPHFSDFPAMGMRGAQRDPRAIQYTWPKDGAF